MPSAPSGYGNTKSPRLVDDVRLSIVHVLAPARVGGLERVVQSLAIGQHAAGFRVLVIAVVDASDADPPFLAPLRAAGVPHECLRLPTRAYLRERALVKALFTKVEASVVHLHGARMDLLHSGVARALGIPVVSTAHGSSRLGWRSNLLEWFQMRFWRGFDAVVAVSRALESMLLSEGVPAARLHMISNGWSGGADRATRAEARQSLGLAESDFVVGFVGRLIAAKGPDVFIEALARIKDVPWTGVMVGDGMVRAECEALIRAHGLERRVILTGHMDDATALFPAFDAFVLSSRTEGTPIVLFEAMAARVPIVATAVGGVPDVVGAQLALLVPPNDPAALADALRTLMLDKDGASARAANAHQRLQREFGLEAWIASHTELYRSVISAAR